MQTLWLSHHRLQGQAMDCRSYRFHSCEILVSSGCGGPFLEPHSSYGRDHAMERPQHSQGMAGWRGGGWLG